jgi:hypothetical protein
MSTDLTVAASSRIVRRCSATVHVRDNASPMFGNLGAGSSRAMAAATDPRRLLGRFLAVFGLDGGNSRALANARGILEGLQAAREQVDALEGRLRLRAPARLGAG